jgi:hypothetical protein
VRRAPPQRRRVPRVKVAWLITCESSPPTASPDRRRGKTLMTKILDSLDRGVRPLRWRKSSGSAALCAADATTCWPRQPPRLQHWDRSDRRPFGSAMQKRPRIPRPHPPPNPLTPALRRPRLTGQCTLTPAEPKAPDNRIRLSRVASPGPVTIDSRACHQIGSTTTSFHPPKYSRLLR